MRVTISQSEFQHLIKRVAGAVPTRTPKEILRYIHMEADSEAVTLTGQGSEHGVISRTRSVFSVRQPGTVLLPTTRIQQIVNECDASQDITIESDGHHLIVQFGTTVFKLVTQIDEYPRHQIVDGRRFEVLVDHIIRAGKRARVTVSGHASGQYAFDAVELLLDGVNSSVSSSDGKAASLNQVVLNHTSDEADDGGKFLLSPELLALIDTASAGQYSETATLVLSEKEISVQIGDTVVFSRLLAGKLPNIRGIKIVPAGTVNLLAGDLRRVLSKAGTMVEKEDSTVKLSVSDGEMVATVDNDTVGHSEVRQPVQHSGDPVKIWFNPQSVLKWIATFPAEAPVELQWQSAEQPMRVSSDGANLIISPKVKL